MSQASPKYARADIETLCILEAVEAGSCDGVTLASRLGLSPALAAMLREVGETLVQAGFLALNGERLALSPQGVEKLRAARRGLGIA